MTETSLLEQKLKSNGYSITQPRKKVFMALIDSEPLSINEILKKVKMVDRASIYRTIDLFERLGIVQRLQIGWKYRLELSDEFHHHHHHFTCNKCHSITVLKDISTAERLINSVAKSQGFQLSSHQIELQGVCKKCLKKT